MSKKKRNRKSQQPKNPHKIKPRQFWTRDPTQKPHTTKRGKRGYKRKGRNNDKLNPE